MTKVKKDLTGGVIYLPIETWKDTARFCGFTEKPKNKRVKFEYPIPKGTQEFDEEVDYTPEEAHAMGLWNIEDSREDLKYNWD
jgi:hypothetical protein